MISNHSVKPDVIIVDDHISFRQGLNSLITIENIANVIAEASDGTQFIELLEKHKPDLVLMDIDMPNMNGLDATKKALKILPDLKIIAFTMFGYEDYYYNMIENGVQGFILKSSGLNELEKAIHAVMAGKTYFSNELLFKFNINYYNKNSLNSTDQMVLSADESKMHQVWLGNGSQENM
jgi:DNA-binding NarL/FixJ family response regulator